ncbi:MAG: phage head closure protein, partial [Syntrophaceae bacterium]
SNVETVCSEKRDLSSRELFQASQVYADVTTMFRIRYRAGLNTKMRIYYDGRYYNIRSIIDPSDRRRELHIMCTGGAT